VRAGMLEKPARPKPANQWSRQELDALFARRTLAGPAETPAPDDVDPPSNDVSSNKQTGV
jgi:hypothetical protein